MIPVPNEPTDYLETVVGLVVDVMILDGKLSFQLEIFQTTEKQFNEIHTFDISNKYDWKVLLQQLGKSIYRDGVLNFSLLKNHTLVISYVHTWGTYQPYVNLISIVIADQLMSTEIYDGVEKQ